MNSTQLQVQGMTCGACVQECPVGVEHMHEIRGLLEFYMGPNTSERRQYIMGHLV